MKKILFLLPVLFLCIFSSCKKCKDCSCSQVISQTGMPDVTQDVDFNNICDDDLEEIEGTITYTQSVAGISQTVEQSCECK
ncbi:MAG: hypothetical protein CMC04_08255 [Flavobacteriaceae bacterium]|jgi:hypothetical protein|nr:hypothetical protein [Flavobacteriaceae bacterium]|tara:strand:+ start:1097 stop:1339 length:243 start_codon:yes stop_codon:yes gene_type:complete